MILDLKGYREERDAGGERVPIVTDGGSSVIDAHTMESCMSCLARMDACPVDIEHVTQFTDLNRRLTEAGEMDGHAQDAMFDAFQHGNTFGEPERARPEWTDELDRVVTYHDPCHLGRYNDVFDAPRELIRATGVTLSEMPRNRADSFCCGGGGGGLWMDFEDDPKPSEERLREALDDTTVPSSSSSLPARCA